MSADVERIAAMLEEHQLDFIDAGRPACTCGIEHETVFDETELDLDLVHGHHVAEQLAAAGFGDKAQAWDEGCARGQSSPANFTPTNPYRQEPS